MASTPCAVPAASVVAENVVAFELARAWLGNADAVVAPELAGARWIGAPPGAVAGERAFAYVINCASGAGYARRGWLSCEAMSNWFDFLKLGTTYIPEVEIAARLLLAALFAAAIGFEREMRKEPAGLRTHMLTALAAAMFRAAGLDAEPVYVSAGASGVDADRSAASELSNQLRDLVCSGVRHHL